MFIKDSKITLAILFTVFLIVGILIGKHDFSKPKEEPVSPYPNCDNNEPICESPLDKPNKELNFPADSVLEPGDKLVLKDEIIARGRYGYVEKPGFVCYFYTDGLRKDFKNIKELTIEEIKVSSPGYLCIKTKAYGVGPILLGICKGVPAGDLLILNGTPMFPINPAESLIKVKDIHLFFDVKVK